MSARQHDGAHVPEWNVGRDGSGELGLRIEQLLGGRPDVVRPRADGPSDTVRHASPMDRPDEQRERAARLLQQQLALAEQILENIVQSQRQRDLHARLAHGPVRPEPTFVDEAL